MGRGCKKRRHTNREAAERLAKHLSRLYMANMAVYKCHRKGCDGKYFHLTERKAIYFNEVKDRKREFS